MKQSQDVLASFKSIHSILC